MRQWVSTHGVARPTVVFAVAGWLSSACGFTVSDSATDAAPPDSSTPRDCNDLHKASPQLSSGTYLIDPDGTGGDAAYNVTCDMVADGGGWTIVFLPVANVSGIPTTYDSQITTSLLSSAQSALLAYRDQARVVTGEFASFALPADWRTEPPLNFAGRDQTAFVSMNGGAPTSATVRYGYQGFNSLCTDAWDPSGPWGRICVTGTRAPYFAGFATTAQDSCSNSMVAYNTTGCSSSVRFSIAVR